MDSPVIGSSATVSRPLLGSPIAAGHGSNAAAVIRGLLAAQEGSGGGGRVADPVGLHLEKAAVGRHLEGARVDGPWPDILFSIALSVADRGPWINAGERDHEHHAVALLDRPVVDLGGGSGWLDAVGRSDRFADEFRLGQHEAEVARGCHPVVEVLAKVGDAVRVSRVVNQVHHLPGIGGRVIELLGWSVACRVLPLLGTRAAGAFQGVEVGGERQLIAVGVADQVGQLGQQVAGVAVAAVGDGAAAVVDSVEAVGVGMAAAVIAGLAGKSAEEGHAIEPLVGLDAGERQHGRAEVDEAHHPRLE